MKKKTGEKNQEKIGEINFKKLFWLKQMFAKERFAMLPHQTTQMPLLH